MKLFQLQQQKTTEVAEEAAPVASAPAAEETVTTAETSAPAATVSGSEAEAKEWIAQKESGGSYTATNGQYIGRYQLTDSYLMVTTQLLTKNVWQMPMLQDVTVHGLLLKTSGLTTAGIKK